MDTSKLRANYTLGGDVVMNFPLGDERFLSIVFKDTSHVPMKAYDSRKFAPDSIAVVGRSPSEVKIISETQGGDPIPATDEEVLCCLAEAMGYEVKKKRPAPEWVVGDRFIKRGGLYEIVGEYPMSFKTQRVIDDGPKGQIYSMCPDEDWSRWDHRK